MDGNGRWAEERGLPRAAGHRHGAENLGSILECAGSLGIQVLTLYAFSSDNWRRPRAEVEGLMELFRHYLRSEARRCRRRGLRLQVIGRRDRLPAALLRAVEWAEWITRRQRRLLVRLAIDYSARWAICSVAAGAGGDGFSAPAFRQALARVIHSDPVRDPDLIVRTGGEQRLSDFLLWESAYSELVFSPCMFPDFGPEQLRSVVAEFGRRRRRFGGLDGTASAAESDVSHRTDKPCGAGSNAGSIRLGSRQAVETKGLDREP